MPDFRYAQFCPLARAAEVIGERWTLLIVRELLVGPQRFSDLRRRLPGLSSSVLSSRVRSLESDGIVARRQLPPPAGSTVIELTALGQALRPVMLALGAWGIRRMEARRPGDHYEPSWLPLGLAILRSPDPSPARCFALRVPDAGGELRLHVAGGPSGTHVFQADEPPPAPERIDATIRAEAPVLLGVASGAIDPLVAWRDGRLELDGDPESLRDLPALFSIEAALAGRSIASAPDPESPSALPSQGARPTPST